jgi:hypothetical protein
MLAELASVEIQARESISLKEISVCGGPMETVVTFPP